MSGIKVPQLTLGKLRFSSVNDSEPVVWKASRES